MVFAGRIMIFMLLYIFLFPLSDIQHYPVVMPRYGGLRKLMIQLC